MPEQRNLLGGKVYVYKRPKSSLWQRSTYLAGKNRRVSTKGESLAKAKEIAEGWYLKLRGKLRCGEIRKDFSRSLGTLPARVRHHDAGQRNQRYVDGQRWRSGVHLVPFFANLGIFEITAGKSAALAGHAEDTPSQKLF